MMTSFESMFEAPPPDRWKLESMVKDLHELVTDRYISVRYKDFFDEKYPGGNPSPAKDELILPFRTSMTEAEDQELLAWCAASAEEWIDQINERIDLLMDKNEAQLEDLSVDMQDLAARYETAYDHAKMHIVVDRFEEWNDDAGDAIRTNYSDHLKTSTTNQAEMAYALANSAHLDYAIMLKIRSHVDGMVQTAGGGPRQRDRPLRRVQGRGRLADGHRGRRLRPGIGGGRSGGIEHDRLGRLLVRRRSRHGRTRPR